MRLTRTMISLAAAGTLLTGCGTVVPGTAVPDPDAPAVKLDTGGLSTKPRTPTAPGSQRKVLAANMLSERTVIPSDIESAYTDGGAQTAVTARNFISLESEDTDRIAKRGMLYGFMDTRSIASKSTDEGLAIYVIRMTDEAAAKGAVADFRTEGKATEAVPAPADLAVRKTPPNDTLKYTRFTALTSVGPHLIIASPWGTDENKARGLIAKTVDAQRDLLAGFTSPGSSDLAGLPLDKDGIVSFTVVPDQAEAGSFDAVYGFHEQRTSRHWDDNPITAGKLFADTGMDLVGHGKNTVYRTRDTAAAQQFIDRAASEWLDKLPSARPFAVDGLPTAKCRSHTLWVGSDTPRYTCYIAVGRYISTFTDNQAARVRQVTSAAYLILKDAK